MPGLGKSATATNTLLQQLELSSGDVSEAGLAALERLAAERDDLAARLAIAEDLADRDMLTPTLNRRAFLRELHRTMSEVERYKSPAAVLYFDLDGFKALNDGYGHAAGDAMLKHVGRVLADSVRESDIVGRLGGDEFGIILNRAPADDARAKAASLHHKINSSGLVFEGHMHRVQVSIGVHVIAMVEDPETAIARADEAMYADKYARRAEAQAAFAAF